MHTDALRRFFGSMLFRILILFLILYILYHAVQAMSDKLTTDVVLCGSETYSVSAQATLFRDEATVSLYGTDALFYYPNANGAKVNKDTLLFQAAIAPNASALQTAMDHLSERIRALDTLQMRASEDRLADLSEIRSETDASLLDVLCAVSADTSFADIQEKVSSFQDNLDRVNALITPAASLSALRNQLLSQQTSLLYSVGGSQASFKLSDVLPDQTGGYFYYADSVDGYEGIFTSSLLADMTAASYAILRQSAPAQTGVGRILCGKLVTDYRWYLALSVDVSTLSLLSYDKTYTITFSDEKCSLPMTLYRLISAQSEGEASVAVFCCDRAPADFSYPRFSNVQLTLHTVEGYRIPETALTEQNGAVGVFVLDGGRVSFRRADILLREDGYAIVYQPSSNERENDPQYAIDTYVTVRDILITAGKDLYDGKYID